MEFSHTPVMVREVIEALAPKPGGFYVDGTAGGGGHVRALLEQVGPEGRILAVDQDPQAIGFLEETLKPEAPNVILVRSNFSDLPEVLENLGLDKADGMVLDLGMSSFQLDESGRGFSFDRDEPLDMRMDPDQEISALDLVNRTPEKELADIFYFLGEERGARRVARSVVWTRKKERIRTTGQLAQVIRRALRRPGVRPRIDPATRTFMALRLAVNKELDHLKSFLDQVPKVLKVGGKLAVISFHSLEDRLVKQALARSPKVEPTGLEVPEMRAMFKKPLRPSEEEVAENPRARSARLRVGLRVR